MRLISPGSLPFWIAHRGAGRLAPENTLAAFELGARWGWQAFECDVKLSADGVPFLLHDAELDRTTSGKGPAGSMPWETLRHLDAGAWHSPQFKGERLLSLQALSDWANRKRLALNLEIKPSPGDDIRTGQAVASAAARLWPSSRPPLLSSFSQQALAAARVAAPNLPLALLLSCADHAGLDDALRLGCVAIVAKHPTIRADWLSAVHLAGLRVLAYTVNDRESVQRLLSMGIDGIISDAVDTLGPDRGPKQARSASDAC